MTGPRGLHATAKGRAAKDRRALLLEQARWMLGRFDDGMRFQFALSAWHMATGQGVWLGVPTGGADGTLERYLPVLDADRLAVLCALIYLSRPELFLEMAVKDPLAGAPVAGAK